MPISRVPSFSGRPGFPAGLKVLVIDPDSSDLSLAVSQLQQCNYEVHGCENEAEAEIALQSVEGRMDVILWQTSVVSASAKSSFLPKIADVPLVLMGENSTQQQMVTGLKLGAVDFLEKPISMLKLRNIWQHTVRKMLTAKSSGRITRAPSAPTKSAANQEPAPSTKSEPDDVAVATLATPSEGAGPSTWHPSERHDESTGSSEALQHSDCGTGTGSGVTGCATKAAAARTASGSTLVCKAESRRQVSQPAESQPCTKPVPVQPSASAPMRESQSLPSASTQYCMQGMPAPLPGCVWGLPMLPPPVPGLVGLPVPWMQGMMPAYTPHGQPQATASLSSSLSNQPQQAQQQQQQAYSMPHSMQQPHMQQQQMSSLSPGYWVAPTPPAPISKGQQGGHQATCTTGSNSNSDATWHMDADVWAGMEDIFELDDPQDPEAAKQDLNDVLNVRGVSTHPFDGSDKADHTSADLEPNFELESVIDGDATLDTLDTGIDEAFDASFGLLGSEYDCKMHNSPSLLDMMDNLCPQDVGTGN